MILIHERKTRRTSTVTSIGGLVVEEIVHETKVTPPHTVTVTQDLDSVTIIL